MPKVLRFKDETISLRLVWRECLLLVIILSSKVSRCIVVIVYVIGIILMRLYIHYCVGIILAERWKMLGWELRFNWHQLQVVILLHELKIVALFIKCSRFYRQRWCLVLLNPDHMLREDLIRLSSILLCRMLRRCLLGLEREGRDFADSLLSWVMFSICTGSDFRRLAYAIGRLQWKHNVVDDLEDALLAAFDLLQLLLGLFTTSWWQLFWTRVYTFICMIFVVLDLLTVWASEG